MFFKKENKKVQLMLEQIQQLHMYICNPDHGYEYLPVQQRSRTHILLSTIHYLFFVP